MDRPAAVSALFRRLRAMSSAYAPRSSSTQSMTRIARDRIDQVVLIDGAPGCIRGELCVHAPEVAQPTEQRLRGLLLQGGRHDTRFDHERRSPAGGRTDIPHARAGLDCTRTIVLHFQGTDPSAAILNG